jgi:benzoate membrane transport protein
MSLQTPVRQIQARKFFAGFNSAAAWAGVTAFIFMVFGALTVQISVLKDFGISQGEQSSWITITWLTASLVTLPLCLYYRQPLAIGWTIPGLVYMGSLSGQFSLQEFAAADLVAGFLILALGVAGFGSKVIYLVPMPILMGMFGASIIEYETRLVDATVDDVLVAGPMVAAYVLGRLANNRQLPPVGLAVIAGAVMVAVLGRAGHLSVSSTLPSLAVPGLDFNLGAVLSVSLPMVVLVLGIGNVQSLGFMISGGFRAPLNVTTVLIGVMTTVNAVFGGHPTSMARTVTAIVSGRDAGPLDHRYWAAVIAFAGALTVALITGVIVALIGILPAAFVFTMAGLALLGAFQDALTRAFAGSLRLGSVVAFVVTLSTFTGSGNTLRLLGARRRHRDFACTGAGRVARLLGGRDGRRARVSGRAGAPGDARLSYRASVAAEGAAANKRHEATGPLAHDLHALRTLLGDQQVLAVARADRDHQASAL